MSEDLVDEEPVAEVVEESGGKKKKVKAPKAPKPPKRPSDFEIVRSILQRTSERKQAYLLKNLGEDPDLLVMCSHNEDGFTFGNPELSISMLEIVDPELKAMIDGYLEKLYGLRPDQVISGFVCLRDQISELGKTKGEGIELEVSTNDYGSAWCMRLDNKGEWKPHYYAKAIESLFHVQLLSSYCKSFRPILDGESDQFLTYPHVHTETDTASIVRFPPQDIPGHPIAPYYPHGFRARVTKGLDVILTKGLTGDFPYPVVAEDMVIFSESGVTTQFVHRVVADGWRMIMIRPNVVFMPSLHTHVPTSGNHHL